MLRYVIAISHGITLVVIILATAHLFGSPIEPAYTTLILTKFWILLAIVLKSLNSVEAFVGGGINTSEGQTILD